MVGSDSFNVFHGRGAFHSRYMLPKLAFRSWKLHHQRCKQTEEEEPHEPRDKRAAEQNEEEIERNKHYLIQLITFHLYQYSIFTIL